MHRNHARCSARVHARSRPLLSVCSVISARRSSARPKRCSCRPDATTVTMMPQPARSCNWRLLSARVSPKAAYAVLRCATWCASPRSGRVRRRQRGIAAPSTPTRRRSAGQEAPAGAKPWRADMPTRPVEQEPPIIHLQARALEGTISQQGETLELHLQDLGPELRGRYVTISVPLGALIEPVRWIGGNPRAIRSAVPVDANGQLTTPLGETALRLSDPEERNLLEAMFMLLEVRPAS